MIITVTTRFTQITLIRFGKLVPSRTVIIDLVGNVRHNAGGHVSRIIHRSLSLPTSQFTTVSKPGLSGRVTSHRPTTAIITYAGLSGTAGITRTYAASCFGPFIAASIVNLRVYNDLGGIATLTINVTHNTNCNRGATTVVRAHKLTRLATLNMTTNTSPGAFFNLTNINSLVTAYNSSLSHGCAFNTGLNGKLAIRRTAGIDGNITRNIPAASTIITLNSRLSIPAPLTCRVDHILGRNVSYSRVLTKLFNRRIANRWQRG